MFSGCEDITLAEGGTCQETAVSGDYARGRRFPIDFYFTDGEVQD